MAINGSVRLYAAQDVAGNDSEAVLRCAYFNAVYETGFANPIDAAIRAHRAFDTSVMRKLDEIPYDFLRKRLSVLVEERGRRLLITKGALTNVLEVCASVVLPDGGSAPIAAFLPQIEQHFAALSAQGFRVLGIASRAFDGPRISRADERALRFEGFLVFVDPPKPGLRRRSTKSERRARG